MAVKDINRFAKPRILYRKHIRETLEKGLRTPLLFVVSGMGFGKTTAVREFIKKKQKIKYVWFTFDNEETEDIWQWVRFCRCLEQINAELSKKLIEYGIPHSQFDVNRLISIIASYMEMDTIVIFDDMHLCRSEFLFKVITNIALADLKNLHFICISRTYPEENMKILQDAGRIMIMSQESFVFSSQESEDFFILNDLPLNDAEISQMYEKTEGWTSELYLSLIYYRAYESFKDMPTGMELMRKAVYEGLDEATQNSMLMLSKVSMFTLDQAEFLTKDRNIRNVIKKLFESNCFVKYDAESGFYAFHAMLGDLLTEEFAASDLNASLIYERQGEWNLAKGNRIGAISAFTKCSDFDRILDIMSERYACTLMNSAPKIINDAFAGMSLQTKLSHPIGYLTYIYSYSLISDIKEGLRMLNEAKLHYIKMGNELQDLNQVMGEIAMIESVSAFNDLRLMFECYERANKYFDGGTSLIFNSDVVITFGVPLTMSLYHKQKGDMQKLVQLVEDEFWIFNHIANGCGAGYEYLIRAEYEYMTGNLESAEMIAYKAIYKAQTRDQCGIILAASWMLLRICIFEGKVHEIDEILIKIMQEVEKQGSPIMLGCYEFIISYMYAYMGKMELIPQWLKEGDMSQTKLMFPARDSGFLIAAKINMEAGDFVKLEEMSSELIELYNNHNKLMGVMVFNMYNGIANYKLGNLDQARESMNRALELAEADNCWVILSENVYTAAPLLEEIGTPFTKKILALTAKYAETKKYYKAEQNKILLTKREREVMELVCNGYTAEAISKIIFVSHSTVKKHIAAAYTKLGVNKKADAIAEYKKIRNQVI